VMRGGGGRRGEEERGPIMVDKFDGSRCVVLRRQSSQQQSFVQRILWSFCFFFFCVFIIIGSRRLPMLWGLSICMAAPDWNYHEVIVIVCVRFSPSPPLVLSLLQQRWFFRASSIVLQHYSLESKKKKKKPSKTIIHRLGVEISFFEAHVASCTFEGNY